MVAVKGKTHPRPLPIWRGVDSNSGVFEANELPAPQGEGLGVGSVISTHLPNTLAAISEY